MSLTSLGPVAQNTLADAVAEHLRRAIIVGELAPGAQLAEPAVAAEMHVSRSPVREALHRLEAEGLVHGNRNHSTYVWDPTPQDVDEIISLRVICETLAAEWAIGKLTADDFVHLRSLVDQQRQALASGDRMRLLDLDMAFHEYVCRRANHQRLMEWWQHIISQVLVITHRRLRFDPGSVHRTVMDDHEGLLSALESRDLQRTAALQRSINARVAAEAKVALSAPATLAV